jgi:transposase
MARTRRRFTPEFKREAVRLVLEGDVHVAQAARDLDVCETSLHRWIKRHKIDHGSNEAGEVTTAERKEIRELRAKVRRLEMERAILKKATAFFAKESE